MKVLVALSGGPESLVTAWLLKKQGMQLRGVYIDVLEIDSLEEKIANLERKLGFPIQVVKAREETKAILGAFRDEAQSFGKIFHPKEIFHSKILFPKLAELQKQHQFEKVATGHRVVIQEDPVQNLTHVLRYSDVERDESSLLLGMNRELLKSLIMPLGSIPESMMTKLVQELDPKNESAIFEMNWETWIRTVPSQNRKNGMNYDIVASSGVRVGSVPESTEIVLGSLYEDPNSNGRQYRIVDYSIEQKRILVTEDQNRKVEEIWFEDGTWFTQGDLKLKNQTCSMIWDSNGKGLNIELIQYEGSQLRARLGTPLLGEAANIFKGQTVLWVEGQEVLGGGRVFRTR